MHDKEIRVALRTGLQQKYLGEADTAVIDELAICGGRNRIDLALVNGVLHGFELKSDYDSLSRLAEQAKGYGTVCDRVTLVVGERHIRRAVELIPDWWGLILVRRSNNRPVLRNLKYSQANPLIDPFSVARLLRRTEAEALLLKQGRGASDCRTSRRQLCEILAKTVELGILREHVRNCIRERRSVVKPRSCGD